MRFIMSSLCKNQNRHRFHKTNIFKTLNYKAWCQTDTILIQIYVAQATSIPPKCYSQMANLLVGI